MGLKVLKFGSSVLRTPDDLPGAVHRIYAQLRAGHQVVAVVSALGDTTDRLAGEARAWDADPVATAALLATGEHAAVALLQLALKRAGVHACGLDARFLRANGDPLDATPVVLDASLRLALCEHAVVVVPGFVGHDANDRTVTLGRGGSDLTALFIARKLGADCTLVKDVDGLYEHDPRQGTARRYARCSWADAAELHTVVQPKAVAFAQRARLRFHVGSTQVGPRTVFGPPPAHRRRRVALLGLGTVGRGVWQRLYAQPERFDIVGVAVRDRQRHGFVPGLTQDPWALVSRDCDLVVELMGGLYPALDLVRAALEDGKDVVTANKRLLAEHGAELQAIARTTGARLLASASVGGAVCALEAAGRERVLGIEAVINGTCNVVLELLQQGVGLPEAVAHAQREGFAEADPTLDLDGTDAADKLALLATTAWGSAPVIQKTGLLEVDSARLALARRRGRVLRLVASATPEGASVGLRELPVGHPLADVRGPENRVLLTTPDGVVSLRGLGAGRWPTTEAVVADCLELTCAV